jgi:hypothetical protein
MMTSTIKKPLETQCCVPGGFWLYHSGYTIRQVFWLPRSPPAFPALNHGPVTFYSEAYCIRDVAATAWRPFYSKRAQGLQHRPQCGGFSPPSLFIPRQGPPDCSILFSGVIDNINAQKLSRFNLDKIIIPVKSRALFLDTLGLTRFGGRVLLSGVVRIRA